MEKYENIPHDVDIILQLQMEQEWGKWKKKIKNC